MKLGYIQDMPQDLEPVEYFITSRKDIFMHNGNNKSLNTAHKSLPISMFNPALYDIYEQVIKPEFIGLMTSLLIDKEDIMLCVQQSVPKDHPISVKNNKEYTKNVKAKLKTFFKKFTLKHGQLTIQQIDSITSKFDYNQCVHRDQLFYDNYLLSII